MFCKQGLTRLAEFREIKEIHCLPLTACCLFMFFAVVLIDTKNDNFVLFRNTQYASCYRK